MTPNHVREVYWGRRRSPRIAAATARLLAVLHLSANHTLTTRSA